MLLQQTILLLNAKDVILPIFQLIPKKKKLNFKKLKLPSSKSFTTKCQKIIISICSFKSNIPQRIDLPSPPTHRLYKLESIISI